MMNYQKIDDHHSNSPFSDNNSIKRVKISDGITSVGSGLFWNTDSITSVDIPNSVTVIGDFAFAGIEGFKNMTIPERVTVIGNKAFGFEWAEDQVSNEKA